MVNFMRAARRGKRGGSDLERTDRSARMNIFFAWLIAVAIFGNDDDNDEGFFVGLNVDLLKIQASPLTVTPFRVTLRLQ